MKKRYKPLDRRIKYLLVVDIETANIVEDAIAYDVGFKVTDRYGRSYHNESYMVADLFLENKDLLDTAYYKEKLPQYWEDYHEGTRKLVSFMTLWKAVNRIMAEYGITEVYAYNAHFDLSGLNRTLRYITKSRYRYFFPYGTKVFCIWHIACQTILLQKSFFKFVDKYNLLNNKGNVPTSAEVCYKYITYNPDFEEEHTGLADVEIETLILAKCLAQHKSLDRSINRGCWQRVNKAYKEWKAEQ